MNKKSILVHGLGSIGMRHARNLIRLGHDVIGYDTDKDKIEQLLAAGGQSDWPKDIDGIVIASPTSQHAEALKTYQAIANVPIFIEKPIATAMVPTTNVIMVGYNLRFHACVKKAREWLAGSDMGEILWANFVCAQENTKYQDSVIFNWSHEIDLALYLLGSANLINYAVKVHPKTTQQSLADLHLFHGSGCATTVHLDYLTKPQIRQFIIVGSQSQIIADLVNRCCWLRGKLGIYIDQISMPQDSWDENYLEEMQAFIDRLDGKDTIGASAQEALNVVKIFKAIK